MPEDDGFERCPDSYKGHNYLIIDEDHMICLNCKKELRAE